MSRLLDMLQEMQADDMLSAAVRHVLLYVHTLLDMQSQVQIAVLCTLYSIASVITAIFVSPELSSVRDYVITHSVCSKYVVCSTVKPLNFARDLISRISRGHWIRKILSPRNRPINSVNYANNANGTDQKLVSKLKIRFLTPNLQGDLGSLTKLL